jgi:hypothetical protein
VSSPARRGRWRARAIMDQADQGRITALLDDFNEAG